MYENHYNNPYIREMKSTQTREQNTSLVPQTSSSNSSSKATVQGNVSTSSPITYKDAEGFNVIKHEGPGYSMILRYKPNYLEYSYNHTVVYNGPCDATFFGSNLIDYPREMLILDKSLLEIEEQLAEWDKRFKAWEKKFEMSNADVEELMRSLNPRKYRHHAPHYTSEAGEKRCTGCCLTSGCLIYMFILVAFLYGSWWAIGQLINGIAYIIQLINCVITYIIQAIIFG